ncbi:MAG: penicillin-binding protein 2 [Mariprofundaceae bacterium]|nr:penicillin-binding protein 2 [Mariprofundaceae bacterium]
MNRSTLEVRNRFERRLLFFHVIGVVLLLVLASRLVDLQWLRYEGLFLQAEQNRMNVVPILPTRGEIVDRNGSGLAVNHISWRLTLIPERTEHIDTLLADLQQTLHWGKARVKRIRSRIRHAREDRPVLLADKLTWKQAAPIAARLYMLPGVDVQAGTHRFYPYGELTSHLIGYLSLAGPHDVRAGILPTEKVGRSGVERLFESRLHGRTGAQDEEVDAHGRRIRIFRRKPPLMGTQLRLSLDIGLQQAAAKALGNRTGAVVVLDVRTGAVLVLLSQPGFAPNRFITGLETEQWKAWVDDKQHPLLNRTLQAAYPPASTFKLLVSMAGLQHHAPLATGATQCPGYLELADRKLRCWKKHGHKHVNLHKALVQSCDVYFYELGDQLGMKAIRDEAELWGFGQHTGIRLTPEASGVIPGEVWRQGGRTRKWFRGETMITAIGQGAITVTPLQLARFAAAIANGGKLLRPHLQAGLPPDVLRVIDIKPQYLAIIRKAMRGVVTEQHGTAHYPLLGLPWQVAGKTGTAQVIAKAPDGEQLSSVAQQNRYKDHAWFMGYAPYKNPRIAFAVFVEHGGHGGSAAAPVAAAIVRAMAATVTQHTAVAKGQG